MRPTGHPRNKSILDTDTQPGDVSFRTVKSHRAAVTDATMRSVGLRVAQIKDREQRQHNRRETERATVIHPFLKPNLLRILSEIKNSLY